MEQKELLIQNKQMFVVVVLRKYLLPQTLMLLEQI